ncbi:MAG: tungsten ABC transporter substrate-binding protein [Gammaproteobacteria bacterium]|nr:MAG: tungsten ABC transporter substrate-binding protein [Gammaproteobacteria bacterium]RLA24448.1 MAG: tungsten ABC transporter substrate-binding protein [Gammaproteobacteria bacterium]
MKKFLTGLATAALLAIAPATFAEKSLKMSTTTSTVNSGLLAVLDPAFEKKYGIRMDVIAVGTGKALRIGGNGDVDVVFVHAPTAELKYVASGDFIDRSAVMHNDFVIVGAESDPAGIGSAKTVAEALTKIAKSQSPFVSRGDDSGTHKKEKLLWKAAGIEPKGEWYQAAGQGMGAVLRIADDKQAYALADRGTQIAYADKMALKVIFEGDKALFNPYHVMAVNPAKHKHVRYDLAKKYIDFVTGKEGQAIIESYRKRGEQLFYPAAK